MARLAPPQLQRVALADFPVAVEAVLDPAGHAAVDVVVAALSRTMAPALSGQARMMRPIIWRWRFKLAVGRARIAVSSACRSQPLGQHHAVADDVGPGLPQAAEDRLALVPGRRAVNMLGGDTGGAERRDDSLAVRHVHGERDRAATCGLLLPGLDDVRVLLVGVRALGQLVERIIAHADLHAAQVRRFAGEDAWVVKDRRDLNP